MIPDGETALNNDYLQEPGGGGGSIGVCDCGGDGGGGSGGRGSGGSLAPAPGKRLKKGPWTAAEDAILTEHVRKYGEGNWNAVQRNSGLARCGKSCRLRWANHLRPNLKKGCFTSEEERLILQLHSKYGNKWARMATQLPGRTDNEIKNFWNTRMKRRLRQGLPLYPQDVQHSHGLSPRSLTPLSPSTPSLSLSSPHQYLLSPHQSYHQSPTVSLSDHNATPFSFSSPLTPHSLPTLQGPLYRFGRLHNTVPSNAHPITLSTSVTPSPSPMLASPLSTPLSQFSTPQLSPMSFEANSPPPTLQTQFQFDGIGFPNLGFMAKSELPSNQLFQMQHFGGPEAERDGVSQHGNSSSGYLDDIFKEAQGTVGIKALWRDDLDEKHVDDGFGPLISNNSSGHLVPTSVGGQWDDSSSVHSSAGAKSKEEPGEMIEFKHEDLSDLLITFPLGMESPEWCSNKNSSNEHSVGQSSAVTDDSGELKMQQLSSSFPISDSSENGSCSWSYMPPIC